jgi:MHS family proline/betaine transporter-like MFS transporter
MAQSMTDEVLAQSAGHAGFATSAQYARNKAVPAAVIGNLLEWYDYAVYGYFALIIGKTFFHPGDDLSSLLASYGAFGAGFVARPLGGVLIGRIGDVRGRKAVLVLTMSLMGVSTLLIGLIPGYQKIGIWAAVLLVTARLVQGFAAGGEWSGSAIFLVEWADKNRRGFFGSLHGASIMGGLLLGSMIAAIWNTVLPADVLADWGWRVPFLLGGLLAPIGLYMRRHIDDTPAFREQTTGGKREQPPVFSLDTAIMTAKSVGLGVFGDAGFYIFLAYMPTFTSKYAHLTPAMALWSNAIGLVVLIVCTPLAGLFSDRTGRRLPMMLSCAAFIIITIPAFKAIMSGSLSVILLQIVIAALMSLYAGPFSAILTELFPTSVRSTGLAIGRSIAAVVFGGFGPFIVTWLISITGDALSPAYYMMATALVSFIVLLCLRETAKAELR